MVGKSQIKLIRSLHQKKYRNQNGLFIVEGIKAVKEVLESSIIPYRIFSTVPDVFENTDADFITIPEADLRQMSTLKNPNTVLAVFHVPEVRKIDYSDWIVILDDVRDPGNLGTIIRLCDWFGITQLVCSTATVDCYNQKVVQASMGSLTRVSIHYVDLEKYIKDSNKAEEEGTHLRLCARDRLRRRNGQLRRDGTAAGRRTSNVVALYPDQDDQYDPFPLPGGWSHSWLRAVSG